MDCHIFTTDKGYLKEVPAPPTIAGEIKSPINISVSILSILDIVEVDGIVQLQLEVTLNWYDGRLAMYNLKDDTDLNTLTTEERDSIWIPQVVFFNTEEKISTLSDEKSYLTVAKFGSYKRSNVAHLDNAFVYKGRDNPLSISRVYSSKFLCKFDMAVYPFDTQRCQVVFVMKGNTGKFTELVVDSLAYLGPIDLAQYFVKDYKMVNTEIPPEKHAVQVELYFGRRLLSTFLTSYLPMIILCIVSFSTNFFKAFFFEAVVTVNLTALLVLTTLFISISESLPKTNYIKMMDIWYLALLLTLFFKK